MDFEDQAAQLGIDREDVLELVKLFITTSQSDMERIRRGMVENVPAEAAAAAHSIKGAAGNLGFEKMAALAQKMECQGKEGRLGDFEAWADEMDGFLNRLRDSLSDED